MSDPEEDELNNHGSFNHHDASKNTSKISPVD